MSEPAGVPSIDNDKAWIFARKAHNLRDTADLREAFYLGCRHVLRTIAENPEAFTLEGGELMLRINDDLHGFMSAAIQRRRTEAAP